MPSCQVPLHSQDAERVSNSAIFDSSGPIACSKTSFKTLPIAVAISLVVLGRVLLCRRLKSRQASFDFENFVCLIVARSLRLDRLVSAFELWLALLLMPNLGDLRYSTMLPLNTITAATPFKPPGICGHGLPLGVGSLLDLSLAGCALESGWRMGGVFPLDSASRRQSGRQGRCRVPAEPDWDPSCGWYPSAGALRARTGLPLLPIWGVGPETLGSRTGALSCQPRRQQSSDGMG